MERAVYLASKLGCRVLVRHHPLASLQTVVPPMLVLKPVMLKGVEPLYTSGRVSRHICPNGSTGTVDPPH